MFTKVFLCCVTIWPVFVLIRCEEEPALRYIRPKCRTDIDCSANAFCFGNDNGVRGYCKCQNGYEMFTEDIYYECLREKKLGEGCKRDIQCQISAGPLAICSGFGGQTTCECNSTRAHAVGSTCYDTKLLNDFCLVDENCLLPDSAIGDDKYAMCHFGVCSCPLGRRPSQNKRSCIPSKKLDEICESDIECQITENAVCRTICTCEAGFTRSLDGRKCLKAALKFGDPCLENDQCSRYLESSICEHNSCGCASNYHSYETKCAKNAKPGEFCFGTENCVIFKELEDEVKCVKGVCTCLHGKSYDEQLCLSGGSSLKGGIILVILGYVVNFCIKSFI